MEEAQCTATRQDDLLSRLTPDELLDVCGPSWAAMTPQQREACGSPYEKLPPAPSLAAIGDLLDLALRFPRCVAAEGLEIVAERWYASDDVVALAQLLDSDESNGVPLQRPPLATRPVADVADRKEGTGRAPRLTAVSSRAPRSLRLVR